MNDYEDKKVTKRTSSHNGVEERSRRKNFLLRAKKYNFKSSSLADQSGYTVSPLKLSLLNADDELQNGIHIMQGGGFFRRLDGSESIPVHVCMDDDNLSLTWRREKDEGLVYILDIQFVTYPGYQIGNETGGDIKQFTIIYGKNPMDFNTLTLVHETDCNIWVSCLRALLLAARERKSNVLELFLTKNYLDIIARSSTNVEFSSLTQLFGKNRKKAILKALEDLNISLLKNNSMAKEDFTYALLRSLYFELVDRPDLYKIFSKRAKSHKRKTELDHLVKGHKEKDKKKDHTPDMYWEFEEFYSFLKNTQQLKLITKERTESLIEEFEFRTDFRIKHRMSFRAFHKYMTSSHAHLFNAKQNEIHEDMTQSLAHYFINSSHNTYLTGHQLRGQSTVEMYIKILLTGCRCIELDCWDGEDGDPIIYHGRTLTTKIKFSDTVKAIKVYAFVASPYPVILSFENHCSISQQIKMSQYCIMAFGSSLQKEFLTGEIPEKLPSPEQLKYKILIKNKKRKGAHQLNSKTIDSGLDGKPTTGSETSTKPSNSKSFTKGTKGTRSHSVGSVQSHASQTSMDASSDGKEAVTRSRSSVSSITISEGIEGDHDSSSVRRALSSSSSISFTSSRKENTTIDPNPIPPTRNSISVIPHRAGPSIDRYSSLPLTPSTSSTPSSPSLPSSTTTSSTTTSSTTTSSTTTSSTTASSTFTPRPSSLSLPSLTSLTSLALATVVLPTSEVAPTSSPPRSTEKKKEKNTEKKPQRQVCSMSSPTSILSELSYFDTHGNLVSLSKPSSTPISATNTTAKEPTSLPATSSSIVATKTIGTRPTRPTTTTSTTTLSSSPTSSSSASSAPIIEKLNSTSLPSSIPLDSKKPLVQELTTTITPSTPDTFKRPSALSSCPSFPLPSIPITESNDYSCERSPEPSATESIEDLFDEYDDDETSHQSFPSKEFKRLSAIEDVDSISEMDSNSNGQKLRLRSSSSLSLIDADDNNNSNNNNNDSNNNNSNTESNSSMINTSVIEDLDQDQEQEQHQQPVKKTVFRSSSLTLSSHAKKRSSESSLPSIPSCSSIAMTEVDGQDLNAIMNPGHTFTNKSLKSTSNVDTDTDYDGDNEDEEYRKIKKRSSIGSVDSTSFRKSKSSRSSTTSLPDQHKKLNYKHASSPPTYTPPSQSPTIPHSKSANSNLDRLDDTLGVLRDNGFVLSPDTSTIGKKSGRRSVSQVVFNKFHSKGPSGPSLRGRNTTSGACSPDKKKLSLSEANAHLQHSKTSDMARNRPVSSPDLKHHATAPLVGVRNEDGSDSPLSNPNGVIEERSKSGAMVAKELSDLVTYCESVPFKSFEVSQKKNRSCEMSSFVEGAAKRRIGPDYVDYGKRQFSRIYPSGKRIESSNYNPCPLWSTGAQMVALNFQTHDSGMQLNFAKFYGNGGCGYLKKPSFLTGDQRFDPNVTEPIDMVAPVQLTVELLSLTAFQRSEVSNPTMDLELWGLNSDCQKYKNCSFPGKTHASSPRRHHDKSPNGELSEAKYQFKIICPALALLRCVVYDNGQQIGYCAISVSDMELGFRHFGVKNFQNETKENYFLLLKISTEDFVSDEHLDFCSRLMDPTATPKAPKPTGLDFDFAKSLVNPTLSAPPLGRPGMGESPAFLEMPGVLGSFSPDRLKESNESLPFADPNLSMSRESTGVTLKKAGNSSSMPGSPLIPLSDEKRSNFRSSSRVRSRQVTDTPSKLLVQSSRPPALSGLNSNSMGEFSNANFAFTEGIAEEGHEDDGKPNYNNGDNEDEEAGCKSELSMETI